MVIPFIDPTLEVLGDPTDLSNYLPDSGATQHITPRLADLFDVVGGQKLGVEVADGHVSKCTTSEKIAVHSSQMLLPVLLTSLNKKLCYQRVFFLHFLLCQPSLLRHYQVFYDHRYY